MKDRFGFRSLKEAFEVAVNAEKGSEEFSEAFIYCIYNSSSEVKQNFFKMILEFYKTDPLCLDEDGNPCYEASLVRKELGIEDEEISESNKRTVNGVLAYCFNPWV